ncbi:cytoplasmic tRNA 2-thiolation protein 2 isoform X1 [Myzus persicae]|uniref:cytoplasmic tRNA 2-thiolation protein 2 isoform X1 n=2 Tax=Myzus persicae TaxID=13164 RepID=UPI000B939FEF|nr:cytoplasmic tRNA 2-thiolation protein 2 isoform X1 [Myzus persicae]
MCSVNEEGTEAFEVLKPIEPLELKCRKCLIEDGNVVLQKKFVYCKTCFVPMVTHKFRATLGKSKLVNRGERVLVCVSGSQSSVSLLHMIWTGLQQSTYKRLTFDPVVLYIDESVLHDYPQDQVNKIQEFFEKYGLTYHIVKFAAAVYSDNCLNEDTNIDQHNDKLKNIFNNLSDLTLKEDMLMKLRKRAITKLADLLKCTRIMTAENEHKLSIRLLSNVALGRGSQISLDIGLAVNNKNNDKTSLVTIRPMRNLSAKEISYYALFNKLDDFMHSNFLTATSEDESIQKTTERFVNDLQVDFPSTVSTIFRTGEKISEKTSAIAYCLLCLGIMEVNMSPSSAMEATKYSKYVSLMGVKALKLSLKELKNEETNEKTCNGCKCKNKQDLKEEIIESLCYACTHIIQDLESLDDLPEDILNKEKERLQFKKMEEQIKDFLL